MGGGGGDRKTSVVGGLEEGRGLGFSFFVSLAAVAVRVPLLLCVVTVISFLVSNCVFHHHLLLLCFFCLVAVCAATSIQSKND